MCEFLLQNGALVVPNNKTGQNSFHVSCLFGHVGCARLLLQVSLTVCMELSLFICTDYMCLVGK